MNDSSNQPIKKHPREERKSVKTALVVAILAILVLVIGFHLLFPALGIAVAVTALTWGFMVATIAALCVAGLLFFILPGILILIVSLFAAIWVIIVISLFPFLFPLLIPLLIILLFIAFIRRRRYR